MYTLTTGISIHALEMSLKIVVKRTSLLVLFMASAGVEVKGAFIRVMILLGREEGASSPSNTSEYPSLSTL